MVGIILAGLVGLVVLIVLGESGSLSMFAMVVQLGLWAVAALVIGWHVWFIQTLNCIRHSLQDSADAAQASVRQQKRIADVAHTAAVRLLAGKQPTEPTEYRRRVVKQD